MSGVREASAVPYGESAAPAGRSPLLAIRDLSVWFPDAYGDVRVLDGIELDVGEGESVGLVGESGSGKSLLGLSIMGLAPRGSTSSGRIDFRGQDLRTLPERRLRRLRGREIAMIYQDALTSLNPARTIARTLGEVCDEASSYRAAELLDLVALPASERILGSYPHELSGGQRQRVLIAFALAREPALVVADEPTTALDVTVQAQIVALLQRLQSEVGFALLLISHDLGLVTQVAQRIAVMYAGQLIEIRPTRRLLGGSRHPYTRGLLESRLSLEQPNSEPKVIPGTVPSPGGFPSGCRFRNRCSRAEDDCAMRPGRVPDGKGSLACFHPYARGKA